MIAEEEEEVMFRISKLISNTLLTNPALEPLMLVLIEEKEHGYYFSLMKSIGKIGYKWDRRFLDGRFLFFCNPIGPSEKCLKCHLTLTFPSTISSFLSTSTFHTLMCIHITWGSR